MNQSGTNFGIQFVGGALNCNDQAGCIPLANYSAQEQTYVNHVMLQSFTNIGLDVEGSAFNSGPYENINVSGDSSCITGTFSTIPVAVRIVNSSGKPRSVQHGTINTDACTAGIANMVDWENSGEFADFHLEDGGTSVNGVNIGDNKATIICPVICVEPGNIAQGAYIHNIDSTNHGSNLIKIGSSVSNVLITSVRSSMTNTINDLVRSCVVASSARDNTINIYSLGAGGAAGAFFGTAADDVLGTNSNYCGGWSETRARQDFLAQTANVATTTLITTPPGTGGGVYRISSYVIVTQAAGTSSTVPITCITWTDRDSGVAQAVNLTADSTGNTTTTFATAIQVVDVKANTSIQVKSGTSCGAGAMDYSSNPATTMQYKLRVRAEIIG